MRKFEVSQYSVEVYQDGQEIEVPIDPVTIIKAILFAPVQGLNGDELYVQSKLFTKIKAAVKDGFVLLDDAEYQRLDNAFSNVRGLGFAQVETVRRIKEAPNVDNVVPFPHVDPPDDLANVPCDKPTGDFAHEN